jgi:UDP-N-acetylglucosamine 2-epimerase (non-hydrolysing)
MIKVFNIVGARPNFMKAAPVVKEMKRREDKFLPFLVHTGQHYDAHMSDAFFRDLDLPEPDFYLGVGSAGQAEQTARIMLAFEPVLRTEKPDLVLVVGDVNSTLACALTAVKMNIPVAHVEAGLRSFDRTMPEEINRLLTDQISDYLFTHSPEAVENLKHEGIAPEKIYPVGNVMIDSLIENLPKAENSIIREKLNLSEKDYAVTTLHRPSNVDDQQVFIRILNALETISKNLPIIFPVHPRTRKQIDIFGLTERIEQNKNLRLIEPLGYLDFLRLYSGAKLVLTDSGGLQEETCFLRIPCLTLRENTERPITVKTGTNKIVGTVTEKIIEEAHKYLFDRLKVEEKEFPAFWDGQTAGRICEALQ